MTATGTDRTAPARPLRRLGRAASLLACSALLTGCGVVQTRTLETAPLPSAQPLAVDVVNLRGSVEVRVDDRLTQPRARAALRWARGVEESQAATLAESVRIETTVDESPGGAVLRLRVRDEQADLPPHWVDLKLTLPRLDGARVVNRDGDVVLVNVAGAVQVENENGAVELRTDRPLTAPVMLSTVGGNIYLQAPPGSQGQLDLLAVDGEVGFASDRVQLENMQAAPDRLVGALAQGANPVVLRVRNGDARVWIIDEPTKLVRLFR